MIRDILSDEQQSRRSQTSAAQRVTRPGMQSGRFPLASLLPFSIHVSPSLSAERGPRDFHHGLLE